MGDKFTIQPEIFSGGNLSEITDAGNLLTFADEVQDSIAVVRVMKNDVIDVAVNGFH